MVEVDLPSMKVRWKETSFYGGRRPPSLNEGVVEVDVLFHKVAVDGRGELHPARQTLAMPNL